MGEGWGEIKQPGDIWTRSRLKQNIQDRKKKKFKKKKSKKNFIVFNNFSSCIIEHIIFNIITTIITEIPKYSEKFRRQKETSLFLCWVFQNQVEKIKSTQQKLTFWAWFCWEDEKKTPSFSANLTVGLFVYLRKKKENLWEKKNEEKKD